MRKRNFFKAAHRDKAERPIIQALRSVGASVYAVSGKDIPDLLVGFRGVTTLLEVKSVLTNEKKDGYTRTTKTKVSKGQTEFLAAWRGGTAAVVHTPHEALEAIGATRIMTLEADRMCWVAENGAFLCEHCWLPENGLHARDCPTRKALARPPKVQSAYRAAKTLEEAMPMVVIEGEMTREQVKEVMATVRPLLGVEGELQPVPGMRMAPAFMQDAIKARRGGK